MNRTITSKEDILAQSKKIVAESGLSAINMRDVAARCGVAVGSVYNYFPSKNDLMIATVEAVWLEIMNSAIELNPKYGFCENVENLFKCIRNSSEKYPLFFTLHSLSFEKSGKLKGKKAMNDYFERIKSSLLNLLKEDKNVNREFFSESCTMEAFVEFVFSNVIALLLKQEKDCAMLSSIIKKVIY